MSNKHARGFSFPFGKQYFKRRQEENLLSISLWLGTNFNSVNTGAQSLVLCDTGFDQMTGSSEHTLGSLFQSLAAGRDLRDRSVNATELLRCCSASLCFRGKMLLRPSPPPCSSIWMVLGQTLRPHPPPPSPPRPFPSWTLTREPRG